jgi:ubiquinol-cytochrome c reductase iron-sulfur subunit
MTLAERTPGVEVDGAVLSDFDMIREGARRDGVEIVHYVPRFPVRGTKDERRVERSIALLLVLSGLLAFGFVVAYIWWPWRYEPGNGPDKLYTPVLGVLLGGSVLLLGLAIIAWAKKLLPEEVSVQERHDGSPTDEQNLTGATVMNLVEETGIRRRPLLKAAILLPAGGVGVAVAAPLIGSLIKSPNSPEPILFTTGWNPEKNGGRKVRLTREDGTPIRPEEVSVGGQMTVYPGIPHGASNEHADSPTLLIHLRQADADKLRQSINGAKANVDTSDPNHTVVDGLWENFVAYSKICTHAGCPASLYEQQTNRLLCPCHQSQFSITDRARPIFGPATRRLPMLPLELEEGFLVAAADYADAVGPSFWERP